MTQVSSGGLNSDLIRQLLEVSDWVPLGSYEGRVTPQNKSYLVERAGEKYKLRCCSSRQEAQRIFDMVSLLEPLSIVPPCVAFENEIVVSKYLEGRALTLGEQESLYFQFGQKIGELHSIAETGNFSYEQAFIERAEIIAGRLGAPALLDELLAAFHQWEPPNVHVGVTHADLCLPNLIVVQDTTLIVDEESFVFEVIGCDLIKALCVWLRPSAIYEAFFAGYESRISSQYLWAHLPFYRLYFFVKLLAHNTRILPEWNTIKYYCLLLKELGTPSFRLLERWLRFLIRVGLGKLIFAARTGNINCLWE